MAGILVHLARPVRLLDGRSRAIEAFLQTPLTEQDEKAIREACDATGVRLGEFYHWYLQKMIVARAIQNIDRKRALALIESADHTDYEQMRPILESQQGTLIAVPHHAHYVFTMIALADRLRSHRKVNIFYGRAETHRGNEAFDQFYSVIWGDGSNVEVIHDTRQGLAKALRGLKAGEVVFIMPDAFRNEDQTMVIPFCGRPMNIMLGTAILARKTGAWVQPLVSRCSGRGLGFESVFGDRLDYPDNWVADLEGNAEGTRIADYHLMRRLFSQYERTMGPDLVHWQNMRNHMLRGWEFRDFERDEVHEMLKLLELDPDLSAAQHVVDLRASSAPSPVDRRTPLEEPV